MCREPARFSTRFRRARLRPCRWRLNFYNSGVLDIKLIREKPDFVRQRLATRGAGDEKLVDGILQADEQRRKFLAEVETLKSQRNRTSKEIGALMGQKKTAEAETKKAETRELGDKIAALDKQSAESDTARHDLMLRLPNLPHESVPIGKTAADNPEIWLCGEKPQFAFKPKSHVELCESLKLVDFARGAKLSGSGFLLYTNWGARLELGFAAENKLPVAQRHQFGRLSLGEFIDGFGDAVFPPLPPHVVIAGNETSRFGFAKGQFEVLFDVFIQMVAIDINPVEKGVWELAQNIRGKTAMNCDLSPSRLRLEPGAYVGIVPVHFLLASFRQTAV